MTAHPPLTLGSGEPQFDDMALTRQHRKTRLALAYRLFGSRGWGTGGDGHISVRDPLQPDHFWLLRYGVSFAQATVADLVLVAPDGTLAAGDGEINPTAFYIHGPIHAERTDAVGVAHTHTPYGTPWSACAEPFAMICQEATAFHGDQALFDDGEVDIQDVRGGQRIAAALGDHRLIILRNHGLLTLGDNLDETIGWFVLAERVAEVHCKAPRPRPIGDDDALRSSTFVASAAQAWTTFNWEVRAAVPDPSVVG